MTAISLEQKGLFTFTGNPIIDSGVAVLALIAGKNNFEDITPIEIIDNLESFFEPIKHQYDDSNATDREKKHITESRRTRDKVFVASKQGSKQSP